MLLPPVLVRAARRLMGAPAASLAAIVSLAIAVAVNGVMFAFLDSALLRPPPYPRPRELYGVQDPRRTTRFLSYAEYQTIRRSSKLFDRVGAYRAGVAASLALTAEGAAEHYAGFAVDGGVFRTLGVQPQAGRTIDANDERPDGAPVIVVSHQFWRDVLGQRPDAVGATLRVGGVAHTVVGIMPRGFYFPFENAAFWVPIRPGPTAGASDLSLVVRLGATTRPEAAAAELTRLQRIAATAPAAPAAGPLVWQLDALEEARQPTDASFFYVLQCGTGLVLLIAAANVASVLLARNASRAGELSLRATLGATRQRIFGELIAEGALLAVLAVTGGATVAWLCLSALARRLPPSALRDLAETGLSARIVLFSIACVLLIVAAACVLPSLRASRADLQATLNGYRRTTTAAGGVLRGAFVVVQMALSVGLLTATGVLAQGIARAARWDPGYDWRHLARLDASAPSGALRAAEPPVPSDVLAQRLAAVPGVASVVLATRMASPTGQVQSDAGRLASACDCLSVSPNVASGLGLELVAGRDLLDGDRGADVALVDARTAARLWNGTSPIGRSLRVELAGVGARAYRIVGVTRAADLGAPQVRRAHQVPRPLVLLLARPDAHAGATVFLRTRSDPRGVMTAVLQAAAELMPQHPMRFRATADVVDEALAPYRWYTWIFAALAAIAAFLAAVGLYGLLAWIVAMRRTELAVRMAIGSSATQVSTLMLGATLRLVGAGLAAGGLLAFLATRTVASRLLGYGDGGLRAFVAAALLLTLVAVLAVARPVVRAGRTDPAVLMRAT